MCAFFVPGAQDGIRTGDDANKSCVHSITRHSSSQGGHSAATSRATDGRTAIKTLDWSELVVIDHPEPVEVIAAARATLGGRHRAVNAAEHAWSAALAEYGVSRGDAGRFFDPSRAGTPLDEKDQLMTMVEQVDAITTRRLHG